MITDALLNLVYFFVASIVFVFSGFGDVTVSPNISAGFSAMQPYYSALGDILPIATILSIITFVLLFDLALLTYRLIRWAYQKVPGVN
jgi:hypothetical protein